MISMTYTDDTLRTDLPPSDRSFDSTPQSQKTQGTNFLNDFKDLHIDLTIVVEHIVIAVITPQAPPNPSYAIVVADLSKPIVDYSEVVNIVVE